MRSPFTSLRRNSGGGWEERYWKPTNVPVLRPDGSIAYIIHRVEDVTEMVRMRETEARHTEQLRLLESVALNANDAVLILAGDPGTEGGARIIFANEAFTRMTGYSFAEVEGRDPEEFLIGPGTDRAALAHRRC